MTNIITKSDVKNWIIKVNKEIQCGTPVHSSWDESIWRKTYDEIVEYVLKRYNNTKLITEYYMCLLYLEKHLPEKLRYLPWTESDQYKKAIGIRVKYNNLCFKSQSIMNKVQMFNIRR